MTWLRIVCETKIAEQKIDFDWNFFKKGMTGIILLTKFPTVSKDNFEHIFFLGLLPLGQLCLELQVENWKWRGMVYSIKILKFLLKIISIIFTFFWLKITCDEDQNFCQKFICECDAKVIKSLAEETQISGCPPKNPGCPDPWI